MPDIATATPDEWQSIRSLRLAALDDAPAAFGSTLAREEEFDEATWRLLIANAVWFVARVSGHPVGMVAGYVDREEPRDRTLVSLWVSPGHRGAGLGRLLALTIAEWARADAASGIRLKVAVDNAPALSLYRSLGFVDVEAAAVAVANGADAITAELAMRLELD